MTAVGLFNDLTKLTRQSRQALQEMDVSAMLDGASTSMADATAVMNAAGERPTGTVAVSGTPTVATIIAVRPTGRMANSAPLLELDLLLLRGGVPTPVTVTEIVQPYHLAMAVAGRRLAAKVGEAPDDVFIDWNAPAP